MKKYLIVGFILIFASSCLKKPGLPQWYSTYSFPVLHDTIKVWDLLGDTSHVVVDSDSIITFNVSVDIDTIHPAKDMKISTIDTTIRAGFGRLMVSNIASGAITVTWDSILRSDMFRDLLDTIRNHPYDSIRVTIPEVVPDTILDTTVTLPRFSWAQINFMSVTIHLQNNFPVAIAPYHIWIYSIGESDTTLIFDGGKDTVNADERIDTTLTIENVFITNRLRIIEYLGVPGRPDVLVSYSNHFYAQVILDSIIVDSARALFQGLTHSDTFNINPTFEQGTIDTVMIDRGHINFSIYNPININLDVNVRSNNLISGGAPFDTNITISPNDTTLISFGLNGKIIVFNDSGISFNVTTDIDSDWIELRNYDSVIVRVISDTIIVGYFSGNFDSVETDIPEIDTTLDIPDTLNLHLTHVYLTGNIVQTLNFAPVVNLTATVINVNGDTVSQIYNIHLRRGNPGNPSTTPIDFDIGNLFWFVPQQVRISGNVVVDGHGSAYRNDWVTGHVEITVPFTIVFSPDTIVSDTSIDSLEVDTSLINRLDYAKLFIRVRNRIPLGFSAKFVMFSNWGDTLKKEFTIPPAPHDESGRAIEEKDTTLTFTLTHDEAETFAAPEQTSWIEIYIPQTDTVSIRSSDYIRVDVLGEVRARIGE